MDKKKQMNFNLNNFLLSVSDILDFNEISEKSLAKHHSKRVAYISLKIAQHLNLQPKDMFNLCAYSLFHNYIDKDNCTILEIYDDTSILSKIVNFSHDLDQKYNLGVDNIENREAIKKELLNYDGDDMYKQNMIDIFLELSKPLDFWLDLQNENTILHFIYSSLYDFTIQPTFEKVLEITTLFGSLYEDNSKLLKSVEKMTEFYNFDHKDRYTFLIAASMANFGKLKISKEILEKTSKLDHIEYELVKENLYYNKQALIGIYGFEDISKWATRTQEFLDGSGYPFSLNGSHLSLKDRLLSILNIYNSLRSKKSYRDSYSKDDAIKIMKEMGDKIDQSIVDDIKNNL